MDNNFIDSLGLPEDKAAMLRDYMRKQSFYRGILYKAGIYPHAIEGIMKLVDVRDIDESKADILTEKARVEWADLIK